MTVRTEEMMMTHSDRDDDKVFGLSPKRWTAIGFIAMILAATIGVVTLLVLESGRRAEVATQAAAIRAANEHAAQVARARAAETDRIIQQEQDKLKSAPSFKPLRN